MVRVLHVITSTDRGGLETMLMNYYRHIDHSELQFDFLQHRSYKGDYDEEMRSLGANIYELPRMNPFSKSYLKQLDSFFAAHPEYKIVHVHQDCMSSVILRSAYKNGVPIRIAHSHSNNQDKNLKYPIKLYFRGKINKYATHLFACSDEAGKWMFRTDKFEILKNAIDAEQYIYSKGVAMEKRGELGIDKESLVVGLTARFAQPKNHELLIDIFRSLKNKHPNAKLLLIGDGPLRERIHSKVRSMGLDADVVFAGVRDDVNALVQAMDVFVMPSLYEGLPLSIIEAQAAGIPCLISDKVPFECAVTENIRSLSLNESVDTWSDTVLEMAKLGRTNQYARICESGFDIRKNAKKLQDFYLGILARD